MSTEIERTLDERGSRYGKFEDHAKICQELKDTVAATDGWKRMLPFERQALEVILDKVARMCNGDPHYIDNWHDIQGYAKLVEDCLEDLKPVDPKPPKAKPAFDVFVHNDEDVIWERLPTHHNTCHCHGCRINSLQLHDKIEG